MAWHYIMAFSNNASLMWIGQVVLGDSLSVTQNDSLVYRLSPKPTATSACATYVDWDVEW